MNENPLSSLWRNIRQARRFQLAATLAGGTLFAGLLGFGFAFWTNPHQSSNAFASNPPGVSKSALLIPAGPGQSPQPSTDAGYESMDDATPALTVSSPAASATMSPVEDPPPLQSPTPPYIRPLLAPNGRIWPTTPSYLPGYEEKAQGGLSSVVVDNTHGDADFFVKLVSLDREEPEVMRYSYLPAGSQFTFESVADGNYELHTQDLTHGGYSKTDAFTPQQQKTADGGTSYSDIHLTLYGVNNGNMQLQTISPSQF